MDNERKKYIITYVDRKTGKIKTDRVEAFTNRNVFFIRRNQGLFNYLYAKAQEILSTDVSSRYHTHYIKKRNGKLRRIDEPDEELKKFMRTVNHYFVDEYNFIFPSCIYAYVKDRSAIKAARHLRGARQIVGLDIENFFGSCTLDIVMDSLVQIYPFCLFDPIQLETIVMACTLYYDGDYRLPQGAPTSPLFSNLAMLPLDLFFKGNYKGYTRYADDLYFSIDEYATFDYKSFVERMSKHLERHGFKLNHEKSKCVRTRNGFVKVLGCSVGVSRISIGSKKKQILKARIFSFLMDTKNGKLWSAKDVQSLQGTISYCKCIEPDFVESIIKKYEEKTNVSYKQSVKTILYS